jgi:hypothetical protein
VRALLLCLFFLTVACSSSGAVDGLLAHRSPEASEGVERADRASDGSLVERASDWQGPGVAVLASRDAYIQWDLGEPTQIRAALVEADGNDPYVIAGSLDGKLFTPIWEAPVVDGPGMQMRQVDGLDATARWIRISAKEGDGRYGVGEVALFSERPADFPPRYPTVVHPEDPTHVAMFAFGILAVVWALFAPASSRARALLAIVPLAALLSVGIQWSRLPRIIEPEETLMRAVLAAVAAAVVWRSIFGALSRRPSERWTNGTLALLATLSFAGYYHYGHGQFGDMGKGKATYVHYWDMRVYFPVAKYFEELRFDGLYLASTAAYLDETGASARSIANTELRDLHDNRMRRVSEVLPEIQAVRTRFSPARWAEFRHDMRYFIDGMGDGYLESMRDHGGNATPLWLLVAHVLFRSAPASDTTLLLAGLIDPLALLGLWWVVARTFGLRVALVSIILWGTSDFQRFGTNLVGSTMRFDWMVAIGLGVCALHVGRLRLGGVLLTYAALIRAFPVLALAGLALPAANVALMSIVKERRFPDVRAILRGQLPARRAIVAGLASAVVLVAVSSLPFGFLGSWGLWEKKISVHVEKPNANSVGLRNVLAFEPEHVAERVVRQDLPEPWEDWQRYQLAAFARRRPLQVVGVLAFLTLAVAACRRRKLDQAALVGLALVPVLFYAANYYMHFIFLLPLVAALQKRRFAAISLLLLGLNVAQYLTQSAPGWDVIYFEQSVLLLMMVAAMLVVLALGDGALLPRAPRQLPSRP